MNIYTSDKTSHKKFSIKLGILGDANKQGQQALVFEIMKILLDAPISEGGISTEEIKEVLGME